MPIQDKFIKTKHGRSAIWEEGGGKTNTGYALLVTGEKGERLEPIYIRKKGDLSCGHHALFLLKSNMWMVEVDRIGDDYRIDVYQYIDYRCIPQANIPVFLLDAVEAAKQKTRYYHCRVPSYFLPMEEINEQQAS